MDYITTKEAAEKWQMTERRVQILCRNDQIPGVTHFGRSWAIPCDAEKPVDHRVTTGKYRNWRKKNEEKC